MLLSTTLTLTTVLIFNDSLFLWNLVETTARETIEKVMAEALWKAGSNRSAVRAVCLALAGVNHPSDQERTHCWLR